MQQHTHQNEGYTSSALLSDLIAAPMTRSEAMQSLGSVLYAARLDGGVIKIGHTGDLYHRLYTIKSYTKSGAVELIGFRPGTRADEQAIHTALAQHRHHGREYYRPTPEVLEAVNAMRQAVGMSDL